MTSKPPPPGFDYELVCIGSGPAGQRAAVQAAKLGKCVAVVERRAHTGGACVTRGTIPSKTLREAALGYTGHGRRFAAQTRRPPGTRPSMEQLLGGVEEVIRREISVIEHQLRRNDIDVLRGDATFVDPHTLQLTDDQSSRTIRAEKVLIAVGTDPARPDCPLVENVVITSDGVMGLTRLPRKLAVVGAGVIGIEYASIFASLGVEVTVVDQRPRPLEFLDREIVDELMHQMRNMNVTFWLDEAVAQIGVHRGERGVVMLQSGKRIVADCVLYAIGREGATANLNLEAAGLEADKRGRLTVDEHFRTSAPHIYAAGDVVGFPSLAATSSEQGRLAACHAFDFQPRAMSPHFPVGIYAIPEMSMVGRTERQLTEACVPYEVGLARYREIARGQILGDDTGLLKMLFHRNSRELLGVHAVGTGATELIHIGQAVLHLRGGLDYFLETVFNYPTLAECYKVAALDAFNKLSVGPLSIAAFTVTEDNKGDDY